MIKAYEDETNPFSANLGCLHSSDWSVDCQHLVAGLRLLLFRDGRMTPTATVSLESTESERQPCVREAVVQAKESVLPLPLTPFERYMVVDDRPGYPMTFAASLELRGAVSRRALELAVASLQTRHPLLGARLCGTTWQDSNQSFPKVQWSDRPLALSAFDQRQVDLTRDSPFRVEAYSACNRTHLLFSFHHAVCDGKGAAQIVGDVLAAYGNLTATTADRPRLLPTNVELLRQRGELQIPAPVAISRWKAMSGFCTEVWKLISRRPAPLQTTTTEVNEQDENRGMLIANLEKSVFRRFCHQAGTQGVTSNDLLIRDLFCTMKQWSELVRRSSSRRWLRMTVPVNLRSRRDLKMPAANILGYALLTRREGDCDDSGTFLKSLASDMRAVSKWGLGAMFLQAVRIIDRIPGGLYLATRLSRSFSTIVLSNMGDPTRRFRAIFPRDDQQRVIAGDLVLERIVMAPPVRPGTRLAIAVTNYGDITCFAAQYDHRHMATNEASRFLDLYTTRIANSGKGNCQ